MNNAKSILVVLGVLVLCGPGWPAAWIMHHLDNLYRVHWKQVEAHTINIDFWLIAALLTMVITVSGCFYLMMSGYAHLALTWAYTYLFAFAGFWMIEGL